jgi:uncharacterized cupredoxin-like copper-binding protein
MKPVKIRTAALALAALVTASVGPAACGDDDEGEQPARTPTKLAITASDAGKQSRLSVPESVPAGLVTVELSNTGTAFHEAQLVRLDSGHTPGEALKVIAAEGAPSPGWIHAAGGTGPAPPGGSSSATQRLGRGTYMVYDAPFLNEGQGVKFGVASFRVVGDVDGGELPKSTSTIEAYGHRFKASGLSAGQQHGRVLEQPGAMLAEVRAAFKQEQGGGEPPLDFEDTVNTARIDGGTKQITELDLDKPGKYALLCFVSDRKGGPPHVAQGMIAEITVR